MFWAYKKLPINRACVHQVSECIKVLIPDRETILSQVTNQNVQTFTLVFLLIIFAPKILFTYIVSIEYFTF